MSGKPQHTRHGAAAVAMVVILIIIDLIIVGIAIGGSRDHDLSIRRLQTVQAFYAAESGMNMAIRELMIPDDEDGDDALNEPGTISDDGDDANDPKPSDPPVGSAQVVVTALTEEPGPPDDPDLLDGQTRLTSTGRSGEARREMETILE